MVFRILQNILSLLTGHVVSKLISLVSVIFLARRFGVEGFGTFGTIMAYLTLFATIADNGLGTVTIRDVAQDYRRSHEYFSLMLMLRGILTLCSYGLLLLLGWLLQPLDFSLTFIAVCGLMLFPEALRKIGISFLTAYERMELVAGLDVFSIIFRYLPFFIAVFLGKTLHLAFILLPFFWIVVATVWLVISRRCCLQFQMVSLRKERLWEILYEAFPFGIFSILAIIYFKADILMLSKMQGSAAVGLYEGAYKFIEAAMFIPVSIVNVLLPVMSRSFTADPSSYNKICVHSLRLLGMAMLPIAIGVSFFAEEIILIVYRDSSYLPSASALMLLIWALFLIFLNAPVGNVIATSKLMHAFLPYAVGNTLLNIGLNLILIPKYSFLGASFTTLLTECTGFAIQLWFVNRALKNASAILWILGKFAAVGILTSVLYSVAHSLLPFPLNLFILCAMYSGGLFLFRLFEPEDKYWGGEMINMVKSKFFAKRETT